MKVKLPVSLLACGLAFAAALQAVPAGTEKDTPSATPNTPPFPGGNVPGRYVIFEGAAHVTLRMDTATGKTWRIASAESFTKDKAGDSIYIDHWQEFPEKEAMEWYLKNPDKLPRSK